MLSCSHVSSVLVQLPNLRKKRPELDEASYGELGCEASHGYWKANMSPLQK